MDDDPLRRDDGIDGEMRFPWQDLDEGIHARIDQLQDGLGIFGISEKHPDLDIKLGASFQEMGEICRVQIEPLGWIRDDVVVLVWTYIANESFVD